MKSATNVMVLGATNYPSRLDEAAIRPGRFDRKVEVELPDAEACSEILARQLLKAERKVGRKLVEDELDLENLGHYLNGLSGADIAEVVNRVKGTMAKTEKAMRKPFTVAMEDVEFDEVERKDLLISTDDILPAVINYRLNG